MVGSSEVMLSPLNSTYICDVYPSLYLIISFVYKNTTLSLQGPNPICALTPTVHILGVCHA